MIVTLYLTIGSAINIAQGKSGCPEVLPQFAFWRAFFIYVVVCDLFPIGCVLLILLLFLQAGIYFTADIFTCGWCSRTAGPAPASNYDKL